MRTSFSVDDMTIHRIVEQESGFTPMLDFLPTLSKETLGENLAWLAPGGYDSASGNVGTQRPFSRRVFQPTWSA